MNDTRFLKTLFGLLVIMLFSIIILFAFSQQSYAAEEVASGTCGDNLTWTLDYEGTLAISGSGAMKNYHTGMAPWYENRDAITKIVINEGVESIGKYSFDGTSYVKSVSIASTVKSIGTGAFDWCGYKSDSAWELYIPDSVTSIESDSFQVCGFTSLRIPGSIKEVAGFWGNSKLQSVKLEEGIESIGQSGFSSCSALKSISLPNSVTLIGENAFNCAGIQSIDLNNVKTIGNNAFAGCQSLSDITINESTTYLGSFAFSGCSSLKSISLPDSITTIESYAFASCEYLEQVQLSNSINTIPLHCFNGCRRLKEVSIPESVSLIGESAFEGCWSLEKVTIPDSVETIETACFNDCSYDGFTIVGYYGSFAENYAKQNNYGFNTIGDGHKWNTEYTIDVEPTCTAKGSKSKHCIICNEKSEVTTIDALGHDWDTEYTVDIAPTCTMEGSKSRHCANCNEKTEVTTIDALGHDWGSGTITTEPTCTEKGVKTFNCSRCKETKTEAVAALDHTWDTEFTVDVNPTCTTEGSKSKHCKKCDEKSEVTSIDALGHSFGSWIEVTPSTCEGEGVRQHKCDVCGFTESESVDPKGHEWEDDYTVDVPATCTTDGSESIHCKNCEVTKGSRVIPSVGHTYGDWNTTKEPICIEKGSKEKVCSACGDKVTEEIAVLGHALVAVEGKDATSTESGYKAYWKCSRCEKLFSDSEGKSEISDPIVIDPTGSTQEEIEREEALDGLSSTITDAKVISNSDGKYTSDSFKVLQDAIANAEKVAADKNATAKELNDSKTAIAVAKAGLTENSSGTDPVDPTPTPAHQHAYGAWTTTISATEIAEGVQTRTCSMCGETETQSIAQLKPTLPKVTISKPKAAKKAATVKWKKVSKKNLKKIKKIEIQYSLDKTFETGVKTKYASAKKTSYKIKSLKKGKKYYIRIRAYKKSGGKVHVSKWSKVRNVKVK